MKTPFDFSPTLAGGGFRLSPLGAEDFDGLYAAAADPGVWAGHPAADRYRRPVFRKYFDYLLDAGGTLAIRTDPGERIVGCSRFYTSPDIGEEIAVGFTFLTRDLWGGDANMSVKRLMFGHAFESFDAVWLHIAPDNVRSRRATEKLGAGLIDIGAFRLTDEIAEWARYRISRDRWMAGPARAPDDGSLAADHGDA